MTPTRRENNDICNVQAAGTKADRGISPIWIHLSLILILAGLAQILAGWLKSYTLPKAFLSQPQSILIANRFYFDRLISAFINPPTAETPGPRVEYIICLLITLLSCVPVYFIARRWLGTAWALKAGCVYVAYPGLAWFVADVGPLALLVLLVPATWLLLLRWESGQRAMVALCLGAGLAMMYLINFIGLLLLLMMAMGLLLHRPPMRARLISVMAMLLGYAMLVIPVRGLLSTTDRAESETAMTTEFWNAIDNGDGSAIAKAARLTKTSPRPLLFLRDQARESPTRLLIWILRRAWRTLYLYSGSYWDQILFSCQLVWLVPASWGWVTAIRCPNRRWAAVLAGGLIFCCWGMVAVVEPLARNMTPLLGITLVFALAGIQDVYIRIARLRVPTPAGKPRLNVVRKRK